MRDDFDMNVCYKKVFEMLSAEYSIQEMVADVAGYTGTSIVAIDIGGNILASSGIFSDISVNVDDGKYNEILVEFISQYMEHQRIGDEEQSLLTETDDCLVAVNAVDIKGNTEGFVITVLPAEDISVQKKKRIIGEINDLVCQALRMNLERKGSKIHHHASTLRRMIAQSLFSEDSENRLRIRDMQEMYNDHVMEPFIIVILKQRKYNALQMNKAGNDLTDGYHNSFIFVKEHDMYVLFSDVCRAEVEKRIYHLLKELCEKYNFWCGISVPFDDIGLIENEKFMVMKALEIGSVLEPEKKLYMEYDYYVQIICSCAVAHIGRAKYQEAELQKLKQEDDIKGTEFYHTLKEYLLHGNNVSRTSKELFIHRNTMIYRLSKINEILGVDINDPVVSRNLMLSIILQEQENQF